MFAARSIITRYLAFLAALSALSAAPLAAQITDPLGDFLPTYTGPKNGDLDVLSVGTTFDGSTFLFRSTLAANVGITPGALYVFGINRGQGLARFPVIAPGVLFDAVVILRADGTGSVSRLFEGGSSPLASGSVRINGANIEGSVPLAFLPALQGGFAPSAYTVNLWPRVGAGSDSQISDFAPNNSNFAVTTTPEPASWMLFATGLAFVGIGARRKRAD